MANKNITAIEIGTNQVKMVVCSGERVVKTAVKQLPDRYILDGDIVSDQAMSDFLKAMAQENKITNRPAVLILQENDVFTRRITMPYMTEDQLELNLPYEFHDFISEGKGGFNYDSVILDTILDAEDKPTGLDVLAAAASKEKIERLSKIMEGAGFKLVAATPLTTAYANLISAYEEREEITGPKEYCIVDIGYSGTRLHIYKNGRYEVTREIENGCGSAIHMISELKNVDEHVAYSYLMTNYEDCLSLPQLQDVYDAITIEIMRAINFYGFNNPSNNLHDAYYCGGGAKLEPLIETIDREVNLEKHSIGELLPETGSMDVNLYATALGAALIDEKTALNLVEVDTSQLTPKRALLYSLLFVVLLAAFVLYGVLGPLKKVRSEQENLDSLTDELYSYQINNADYDQVAEQYEKYSPDYYNEDEELVRDRCALLDLVEKQVMPRGDVTMVTITDQEMEITVDGVSLNTVSSIVAALEADDSVSYVTVSTASTGEDSGSDSSGGKAVEANITVMFDGGAAND